MANLYGIDVSEHNGNLNWIAIKNTNEIDFAIIRAGYGRNNIDARFNSNITGCFLNNIPVGVYWFSYALSVQDAANEAEYCCDAIEAIPVTIPTPYSIWYDWEYDSEDYAQNHGITITPAMRKDFAIAFCEAARNRGYNAGIYTNPDFLSRGMQAVVDAGYPLWLAQWSTTSPSISCNIWQYGITHISGITGDFDGDMIGEGFPPIPPTPTKPKHKMPIWLALRRFPRNMKG